MSAILDSLTRMNEGWAIPRPATHDGQLTVFRLRCSVGFRVHPTVLNATVPQELGEFWQYVTAARLFEDVEYGQWGLVLLDPDQAVTMTEVFKHDRSEQHVPGDLVVGRFLGDQDLLLVRCDPGAGDFGRVLVMLPLDARSSWFRPAPNLTAFLEEYERAEGAKYWERGSRHHLYGGHEKDHRSRGFFQCQGRRAWRSWVRAPVAAGRAGRARDAERPARSGQDGSGESAAEKMGRAGGSVGAPLGGGRGSRPRARCWPGPGAAPTCCAAGRWRPGGGAGEGRGAESAFGPSDPSTARAHGGSEGGPVGTRRAERSARSRRAPAPPEPGPGLRHLQGRLLGGQG